MRACLWVGVAGVCGLLACSAPPTEAGPVFNWAPPAAGASSAAGGATARAGAGSGGAVTAGAPAGGASSGAGGSAGLPVAGSGGGAGAPASGGAGAGGAPMGGAAGETAQAGAGSQAGSSGGQSAAGGSIGSSGGTGGISCTDSASAPYGSCVGTFTRTCHGVPGSLPIYSYETTDGHSFPCDPSGACAAAVQAFEAYCAPDTGAGGAPGCSATDICCVATAAKVLAQACYTDALGRDATHGYGCANPCVTASPATLEAQCRADSDPFCVWDSTAHCWKCMK